MKKILIAFFCIFLSANMAVAADAISCPDGQYYSNTGCLKCPEKSYCNNNEKKQCPEAYPNSAQGAKSQEECYKTCNGTLEDGNNAYYSNQCRCVLNATRNGGTCTCNTGYQESDNMCEPKVYEIQLKKNCKICTVKENSIYEKYNTGFSYKTPTPLSWTPAELFKVDLNDQNTSRWWGIEFSGYFTQPKGGNQIITKDGSLVWQTNTLFNDNMTLYAQYDSSSGGITIKYVETGATDRIVKCDIDGDCTISAPRQCTAGKIFSGWECTAGCTSNVILQPSDNFETIRKHISVSSAPVEITLTATSSDCPQGYYCTCSGSDSKRNGCPMGSTTDGTGKSTIDDCVIKRGNGGTQFCDSVGCFYLPGTGSIPY